MRQQTANKWLRINSKFFEGMMANTGMMFEEFRALHCSFSNRNEVRKNKKRKKKRKAVVLDHCDAITAKKENKKYQGNKQIERMKLFMQLFGLDIGASVFAVFIFLTLVFFITA